MKKIQIITILFLFLSSNTIKALNFGELEAMIMIAKSNNFLTSENTINNLKDMINDQNILNILNNNNKDISPKDFVDLLSTIYVSALSDTTWNSKENTISREYKAWIHPDLKDKIADFFTKILSGETKAINVLLAGKTRAGKSTLASTLADPLSKDLFKKTTKFSIFSYTVDTSSQMLIVKDLNDNFYLINIIDSPGFFEQKPKGERARSNDEIKENILKEIEGKPITKAFLVMSINDGINQQDINSIPIIVSLLNEHARRTSAEAPLLQMIISRAENYSHDRMYQTYNQLKNLQALENIQGFSNDIIFFTGTIHESKEEDVRKSAYETVLELRKDLLNEITNGNF